VRDVFTGDGDRNAIFGVSSHTWWPVVEAETAEPTNFGSPALCKTFSQGTQDYGNG